MTVYGEGELTTLLKEAGFSNTRAYKNPKGWIGVTVQK